MARVEKSIVVNASVEKVFAFASDPANLPSIWPALEQVTNVTPEANGGSSSDYVYNMGGMRFSGHNEAIEFVPNARVATRSKSGIESTVTFTFAPESGGTRVTFLAEYIVPVPLLGKIAEVLLARQNEQQAETLLANLKAKMEA
ncbi:MAG TPA: SRPBCC family protein [Ktedonobacterales bacterium]|nr:SRPBCC family protein [Ktedonobacterales bacterium]